MVRARNVTRKQRERYNLHLANHGGVKCGKRVLPPFFLRFFFRILFAILFICVQSLRAQAPQASSAPQASAAAPPAGPQPTVTPEMGDVGGTYFGRLPDPAKTRHYYIAAEPVLWNFAPEGQDPVCGKPFPSSLLLNRSSWKIRYVQYADPEFSARVLPSKRLGILGRIYGDHGRVSCRDILKPAWRVTDASIVARAMISDSVPCSPAGAGRAKVIARAQFIMWHLDESSAPPFAEPKSLEGGFAIATSPGTRRSTLGW